MREVFLFTNFKLSGKRKYKYSGVVAALAFAFFAVSCSQEPETLFGGDTHNRGLFEPVRLRGDTAVLSLSDHFLYRWVSSVDSVTGTDRLECKLDDRYRLNIVSRSNFVPLLSEVKVWIKGKPYSLLVKRGNIERVAFIFDPPGDTRYTRVSVTGEVTGESSGTVPLNMIDGVWQTMLELEHGTYRYRLIANGREITDPSRPSLVDPESGREYSLLEVGTINESLKPWLMTSGQRRDVIDVSIENNAEEIFILWENHRLPAEYVSDISEGVFRFRVPHDAATYENSTVRIWAYNRNGISDCLKIPLDYGRIEEDN